MSDAIWYEAVPVEATEVRPPAGRPDGQRYWRCFVEGRPTKGPSEKRCNWLLFGQAGPLVEGASNRRDVARRLNRRAAAVRSAGR